MHQSFVSTAPTFQDSGGIARLWCSASTFNCPRSAGEVRGYNIGKPTPARFSVVSGGAISVVLLPSACPHRVGLMPGL